MKYFIANWKSHKSLDEGKEWLTIFQDLLKQDSVIQNKLRDHEVSIILCPPFHLLHPLKDMFAKYPNYALGAQNISPYPEGSYTGEIAAKLIKDIVNFTIIGHSERRKYFHEKDGDVVLKTDIALYENIKPIVCIRSEHDEIPKNINLVAYEPVEAIGTGQNASVAEVLEMRNKLSLNPGSTFIYGGSVDTKNCKEYIQTEGIDGLLIGSASLNPSTFFSIISSVKP